MRGHTDLVTGVAHLPDGRRIITCSDDGSLRLWNLKRGIQLAMTGGLMGKRKCGRYQCLRTARQLLAEAGMEGEFVGR